MALFIQHGHGKGTKVSKAVEARVVKGILISSKDETRKETEKLVREQSANIEVLLDPQFHALTIEGRNDGKLPQYPFYIQQITRLALSDSEKIRSYVRNCIKYQTSIGLSKVISPTLPILNFRDMYSQKALDFATESSKQIEKDRLIISLVISESAFSAKLDVDEYLAVLTAFNGARGFYLLIERTKPDAGQCFDVERLTNILYFIYVLSVLSEYEIIVGYSDYEGLLYHAVGSYATACGWHNNLKLYSQNRFLRSKGGRRGNPRYSSSPLLTHLIYPQHLDAFDEIGMKNDILSQTNYDSEFVDSSVPDETVRCLAHWQALGCEIDRIECIKSTNDRLDYVLSKIQKAKSIVKSFCKKRRVKVEELSSTLQMNFSYLHQWEESIGKLNDLLSKRGQI